MVINYKDRHVIDNALNNHKCTEQVRSPYTEHAARGQPNPTHLEGEVRLSRLKTSRVTTRCLRIVTECLLTRSMLIKMYVQVHDIHSRFRAGAI